MQLSKAALLILAIPVAFGQQIPKPQLSNVAARPSDPMPTSVTCTASWSGYLQHKGKKVTDAEISRFVSSSLHDGYVLTMYPETPSGIFVDMVCTAKTQSSALEHP
jgi:hypothetical protein